MRSGPMSSSGISVRDAVGGMSGMYAGGGLLARGLTRMRAARRTPCANAGPYLNVRSRYRSTMSLRTPICDLFDIDVPIFLAGMGQVAYAEVCAAVSEAGGFGTLGMVGAPPDRIRDEMREVRKLTDKPFGVDLLAALPEQIMAAIDVIIEEGAAAFIAGLGVPTPIVDRCHKAGVKVMSMCGKVQHALRAEEAGCDVVVAQGTEAGGHTGQVAGMALIPQTVDAVKIPV